MSGIPDYEIPTPAPRAGDDEHHQLLLDLKACRIAGGETMSLTVLRQVMLNCHAHGEGEQQRMTACIRNFFGDGEAVVLSSADVQTFFTPSNLVRLFPAPHELGFLMPAGAREHCGYNLTPEAVVLLRKDATMLEIYSRGVQRVMDIFSVPSATRDPSAASEALWHSVQSLGSAKWGLCSLFYRLLASTFFLDPTNHAALARVYCERVATRIVREYPDDTCGLRKAVSYRSFIASLHSLATVYGTVEEPHEDRQTLQQEDDSESEPDEQSISDVEGSGTGDTSDEEDGDGRRGARTQTIVATGSLMDSHSPSTRDSPTSSGRTSPSPSARGTPRRRHRSQSPDPSERAEDRDPIQEEKYAGPREIHDTTPVVFTLPRYSAQDSPRA